MIRRKSPPRGLDAYVISPARDITARDENPNSGLLLMASGKHASQRRQSIPIAPSCKEYNYS
jgi:hypothetical protein